MSMAFSSKQDDKLYLAHNLGEWQTAFGKKYTNWSLKFGVLIVGEIEQQFVVPGVFSLGEKSLVKSLWFIHFVSSSALIYFLSNQGRTNAFSSLSFSLNLYGETRIEWILKLIVVWLIRRLLSLTKMFK